MDDQQDPTRETELTQIGRRGFLLLSATALVTGCAKNTATTALPKVPWPDGGPDLAERSPERTYPRRGESARPPRVIANNQLVSGMISRSRWAGGGPDLSNMNRMSTIRYITIHHDGMRPFTGSSLSSSIGRLELIRRAHRGRGWADVGYHYVVDRAGRVYEARPAVWQGAHVKDHNEGNLGVMAMGNFEEQHPTSLQVAGVRRVVRALMSKHRVALSQVRTHLEWAPTACPGRNMQVQVNKLRLTAFG